MVRPSDIFNVLILVLLSAFVFIADLIYTKVPTARLETEPKTGNTRPADTVGTGTTRHVTQDYPSIDNRDLLKTGKPAAIPESRDPAPPRATELELRLWGTVTDKSNRYTYAVIEDLKTGQQDLYWPGALLPGATVKLVTREKVVLSVDGRDEVLAMAGIPSEEPDSIHAAPYDVPERKFTLNRSLFEQAICNISYAMNPAGLTRYTGNDCHAGLLITTLWPNSITRRLGLRNGDVLTRVAGKPVATAKDVVTIFENLKSAANTAIQIKRGNRLQLLTYDFH